SRPSGPPLVRCHQAWESDPEQLAKPARGRWSFFNPGFQIYRVISMDQRPGPSISAFCQPLILHVPASGRDEYKVGCFPRFLWSFSRAFLVVALRFAARV